MHDAAFWHDLAIVMTGWELWMALMFRSINFEHE